MATLPKTCPVCGYERFSGQASGSSREYFCECDRCGQYYATTEFLLFGDAREYVDKKHLLSGLIREINEEGGIPKILYKDLPSLLSDSRIPKDDDAEKKARKILTYIRRKSRHYGHTVTLHLERDRAIAYAINDQEFDALLRLLEDSGLIEGGFLKTDTSAGEIIDSEGVLALTALGWKEGKTDESRLKSEQGFIAIRFDDDADPFITAIEEAITESGYKPMCIKEKHYPERVMDKAIGEIRNSRFLVVDLTKNRCAVSFEAGFAYALEIETISVCQKGEKVEDFYAKHFKYVEYEDAADLKQKVLEAISARIPKDK